jgi:hypothetical protein
MLLDASSSYRNVETSYHFELRHDNHRLFSLYSHNKKLTFAFGQGSIS